MDSLFALDARASLFLFISVIALSSFLPLTAMTYYFFRSDRGKYEVRRILSLLAVDDNYRQVYINRFASQEDPELEHELQVPDPGEPTTHFEVAPTLEPEVKGLLSPDTATQVVRWRPGDGCFLLWSVSYCTFITFCGLCLLMFCHELGLDEFPMVDLGHDVFFPRTGSRLIVGMAFLGAYLWGMQYVFRRYSMNDLAPSVYYSLCLRMLFAVFTALVTYNAAELLFSDQDPGSVASTSIWPALAFLIGMFPSQGLRWLTLRLPMFASDSTVRPTPLDMIEGIGGYDSLRLAEEGIDNCYDLATADFVPLVLKTPYSARQLVDWILQAKLCTFVGPAITDLRQQGIRTIVELKTLVEIEDLRKLAAETTLTESALVRARKSLEHNTEIERLVAMGVALGQFSLSDDWYPDPPKTEISRPDPDPPKDKLGDVAHTNNHRDHPKQTEPSEG